MTPQATLPWSAEDPRSLPHVGLKRSHHRCLWLLQPRTLVFTAVDTSYLLAKEPSIFHHRGISSHHTYWRFSLKLSPPSVPSFLPLEISAAWAGTNPLSEPKMPQQAPSQELWDWVPGQVQMAPAVTTVWFSKHTLTIPSSNHAPLYFPKRVENLNLCPHKNQHMDVYSFIHNWQNLEANKMSVYRWRDKQTVIYIDNRILFRAKRKWAIEPWKDMKET